ncbi:fasciclin domain-containing protein [Nocardioidaceae bacterium]|nr:fasciclin domain-containing protein [Nocardioidaceae bacterium]
MRETTMRAVTKTTSAIAVLSALALTAACGGDDSAAGGAGAEPSASGSADAAAELVGAGCADYAKAVPDGPGSFEGMAAEPVAAAAASNVLLTTLTAAVSGQLNPQVNLVDTLNQDEFTVFAPVDDAFSALPPRTVNQLAKPRQSTRLTNILTYHVLPGRTSPSDIEGEQETVNGAPLTVSSVDDTLVVNEGTDSEATVICGGVQTANATVYLIDAVLMPSAAPSSESDSE